MISGNATNSQIAFRLGLRLLQPGTDPQLSALTAVSRSNNVARAGRRRTDSMCACCCFGKDDVGAEWKRSLIGDPSNHGHRYLNRVGSGKLALRDLRSYFRAFPRDLHKLRGGYT